MPTFNGLMSTYYNDGVTTGSGVPTARVQNTPEYNNRALDRLGKMGRTRIGKLLNEIIQELTGTAPGATALDVNRRVQAATPFTFGNGGVVALENETRINRATTAGDATIIDAALS